MTYGNAQRRQKVLWYMVLYRCPGQCRRDRGTEPQWAMAKDKLLQFCHSTWKLKTSHNSTGIGAGAVWLYKYLTLSQECCCFDLSASCKPTRKTKLGPNSTVICCLQEREIIVGKGLLTLPLCWLSAGCSGQSQKQTRAGGQEAVLPEEGEGPGFSCCFLISCCRWKAVQVPHIAFITITSLCG